MTEKKLFSFQPPADNHGAARLSLVYFPIFLVFLVSIGVYAQSAPATAQTTPTEARSAPDAGSDSEIEQKRIERARALAAAHQLETAATELESIRTTVKDDAVRSVTALMLMGIYLEEGNYARAESLLEETFKARSTEKDGSIRTYFALAGQAVNGARSHRERYRSFGINVTDAGLPAEALADLDRLRSLLERMIAQAKEITSTSKAYDSLALLEDVLGIRLSLARDTDDREKWEREYAEAREGLASSQTQIASLRGMPTLQTPTTKLPSAPQALGIASSSSNEPAAERKPRASSEMGGGNQSGSSRLSGPDNQSIGASAASERSQGMERPKSVSTGSLNARANKKVQPTYPLAAKSAGAEGLVRVYVTVDENGKVLEVSSSDGHVLLREAAEEAARQWRFQPTIVGGKPVRLSGYIEFNFAP